MTRLASRALISALTDYLGPLDIIVHRSRDWASATFTGAHHDLSFSIAGDAAPSCKLVALPEIDLPMRSHFVADLRMVSVDRRDDRLHAVIEVLTIEEQ